MEILLLGHGISNNGVKKILDYYMIDYDYLEIKEVKKKYDLIVKSPGIKLTDDVFAICGNNVISDIELVSLLFENNIIAVTGTNGKTTTTMLLNQSLKNSVACGNIGYAVGDAILEKHNNYVAELSSFQLEGVKTFKPKIAVLLNIEQHHMDHHGNYKNYVDAKKKITINQTKEDYLIYNYDYIFCREIAKESKAKKISFSLNSALADCFIIDNKLFFKDKKLMNLKPKYKKYDIANLMAVISTLYVLNINPKVAVKAFKKFKKAPYRAETIIPGVVNDAKSTNPYSTIASLNEYENILLICGGYDKGENLYVLTPYLNKINKVYAYGESKERIKAFCLDFNLKVEVFDTLKESVNKAIFDKEKENTILYSPMFASYDQYNNYLERGEEFTSFVLNQKNNHC